MDIFLNQKELQSLTQRTIRPAQVKVLRAMGIEHKVRPDGSVAVLRDHITKVFDGQTQTTQRKTATPNWDAI